MTDVVFFAGPVMLKPQFSSIDWYGRDVRIIPIVGEGSTHFAQLGASLRDGSGQIVPQLLARYARGIQVDKVALAAFSAGHGLLNEIGKSAADRSRVSAVIQSDAIYIGNANAAARRLPEGLVNWAKDGAEGRLLSVSTTSTSAGATHLSAQASEALIWERAQVETGARIKSILPRDPAPPGRWQRLGKSAYWADLPQLGHGEHHDVAPLVWQAYLAPYLDGQLDGIPPWIWISGAVLGGAGAAYLIAKGTS